MFVGLVGFHALALVLAYVAPSRRLDVVWASFMVSAVLAAGIGQLIGYYYL